MVEAGSKPHKAPIIKANSTIAANNPRPTAREGTLGHNSLTQMEGFGLKAALGWISTARGAPAKTTGWLQCGHCEVMPWYSAA
jgi:hypothetical protein